MSTTGAVRWYRSNSSGIAIEYVQSRLAALRNEYCLSVERVEPWLLPKILSSHYDNTFTVELRILYENGKESRRQWVFRDFRGLARLSSSGSLAFFTGEALLKKAAKSDNDKEEEEEIIIEGFIELRNSDGYIIRELRYDQDGSEWEFLFSYEDGSLIKTETWYKESISENKKEPDKAAETKAAKIEDEEPDWDDEYWDDFNRESSIVSSGENQNDTPGVSSGALKQEERKEPVFVLICTDFYRYSRPGSLRTIERIISKEAEDNVRIPFPRIGPGGSQIEEIVVPRIAYVPDFLAGVYAGIGERADYSVDPRGRILTEVWKDGEGVVIGEISNTWDGDKISSIMLKSRDQTLLVEYEYDREGNRVVERNFSQGVLERSVTSRGGLDIEEIYVNGRLMLRAVWEKGLKKSEERILPPERSR